MPQEDSYGKKLSERLLELAEREGGQAALAKKAGVPQTTLNSAIKRESAITCELTRT